jgi:hypothetical protein
MHEPKIVWTIISYLSVDDIFTARPPSSPYESSTKQKKEANAEDVDIGRKWLGYLIIKMMFNWSALANC